MINRIMKKLFIVIFAMTIMGVIIQYPEFSFAKTKSINNFSFNQEASFLAQALRLIQGGQYEQAVPILYTISRKDEFKKERMQIKYILGSALMSLDLNQIAAFQFVEVIKDGKSKYVKQSVDKLSKVADILGDDTLLNYAIQKIKVGDVPENGRDLIYFRLGEVRLKHKQYAQAAELFSKVPQSSRYFFSSRFNNGLALLEQNRPREAVSIYKALLANRSKAAVNDTNRVIAQLGLARSYYQAGEWENSISAYRAIPKDHPLWHEALFESSWAMLRVAKFRSALSNFQSLHSAFYNDRYIPESLLLRAIVYLYICKYDEMEKVLQLFEKTYGPVHAQINSFIKHNGDPLAYYNEVESAYNYQNKQPGGHVTLPLMVDYDILHEGDVKRAFTYILALIDERQKLDSYRAIAKSPMGAMGKKILSNRFKNTKFYIGEMVKAHLIEKRSELRDLYEQAGFIRYEMINGKKEALKKKIENKGSVVKTMINADVDRSIYVENGYEYWPFDGEYWLDEIGNYHYLGKSSCE